MGRHEWLKAAHLELAEELDVWLPPTLGAKTLCFGDSGLSLLLEGARSHLLVVVYAGLGGTGRRQTSAPGGVSLNRLDNG